MTSHPEWDDRTSGLEVARVFSQAIKGRNFVITGVGPNGIGESTALAIASQAPSTLILASRTQKRMEKVAEIIQSKYPDANVKLVALDLASQDSVRKAATEIAAIVSKVDVLINNAGVFMMSSRVWTEEKIEIQFGVSHIGHFLLTRQLMPLLKVAASTSPARLTRVINVSSQGHRMSPVRFHDYNVEGKQVPPEEEHLEKLPPTFTRKHADGYMPAIAYGQSKTANILFSVSLQKHLKPQGISSYAVHPGNIITEMGRDADAEHIEAIMKTSDYIKTLDEGASSTLVAALDPELNEGSGTFISDCQFSPPLDYAIDPAAADRLWRLSEELVGDKHA